jgi:hypothetical protein
VYAWELQEAQDKLRELRLEEWGDLALTCLTFGLALGATQVSRALAGPLAIGALATVILAARAERSASMKNRYWPAASIRTLLAEPGYADRSRIQAKAGELDALARELDDPGLSLDPACAVACDKLLADGSVSPLFNRALPADDAVVGVRQIRAGFERREAAAG